VGKDGKRSSQSQVLEHFNINFDESFEEETNAERTFRLTVMGL
jgi:hypothetical protein